jgi:hypothetical protein
MSELLLPEMGEFNEAEDMATEQEIHEFSSFKEMAQQGCLRGDSKPFIFMREENPELSKQLSNYCFEGKETQQNILKSNQQPLSYKQNYLTEKKIKFVNAEFKKQMAENEGKDSTNQSTSKTCMAAQKRFEINKDSNQAEGRQGPTKDRHPTNTQKPSASNEANHREVQTLTDKKTAPQKNKEKNNEKLHDLRKHSQEARHQTKERSTRLTQEDEQTNWRQREQEEEQNGEHGKQPFYQMPEEKEDQNQKGARDDDFFVDAFTSYAAEESSVISDLFKMKVTRLDILQLFIEIMKLDIKGREQERISRRLERELQLIHMQQVVENFKSSAKWLFFSSLGSGVLAIASGLCPIVSHVKGEWIIDKLGGLFSSMKDMDKDQFFKGASKLTYAMSEMYKSTGQIYDRFSEGNRTYSQHMGDIHRSNWEENTRKIDEIKDTFKGMENFLIQYLQMEHDTTRQLYSH